MGDLHDHVSSAAAARLLCGDGPGALGAFYQWRRRYPLLDQMSIGEGKHRRWRRQDLEQFLLDLPRHRAAKRAQSASS